MSQEALVTITELAVQKLHEAMRENGKDPEKAYLRIYVSGGGCSGFQYGMHFEDTSSPEDFNFEVNGIKVLIDPISISYLRGATVGFIESITGGGFTVENPNAKSTCGCGQSFDTK